jgi:hypothetical protein
MGWMLIAVRDALGHTHTCVCVCVYARARTHTHTHVRCAGARYTKKSQPFQMLLDELVAMPISDRARCVFCSAFCGVLCGCNELVAMPIADRAVCFVVCLWMYTHTHTYTHTCTRIYLSIHPDSFLSKCLAVQLKILISKSVASNSETYSLFMFLAYQHMTHCLRRFLDFVTACPRLPPGGLASLGIEIAPENRSRYPRTRTCSKLMCVFFF